MDIFVNRESMITPAGSRSQTIESLENGRSCLQYDGSVYVGRTALADEKCIEELKKNRFLRHQDRAVLLAVEAASRLRKSAGDFESDCGIILGTARGAASLLDECHTAYLTDQRTMPRTSPATTASAFTAAVSNELGISGGGFTISAACASSLHAVGIGRSLIKSGIAPTYVVGGAESCLSPFALSMFRSIGICATGNNEEFPVKPLSSARNGTAISEGAGFIEISRYPSNPLGKIVGYGAAISPGDQVGVDSTGGTILKSINLALEDAGIDANEVDLIVGHGTGTKLGDISEYKALKKIFGTLPPLVYHKWCFGHLFGASGIVSLILALDHISRGQIPTHPYLAGIESDGETNLSIQKGIALVLSQGFGGQAVAVLTQCH